MRVCETESAMASVFIIINVCTPRLSIYGDFIIVNFVGWPQLKLINTIKEGALATSVRRAISLDDDNLLQFPSKTRRGPRTHYTG
jgi:hypothetical protein